LQPTEQSACGCGDFQKVDLTLDETFYRVLLSLLLAPIMLSHLAELVTSHAGRLFYLRRNAIRHAVSMNQRPSIGIYLPMTGDNVVSNSTVVGNGR